MILKDSVGNEIHEGAILRWYHYSSNKRKEYMYKQVGEINGKDTRIYHLPIRIESKEPESFRINSYANEDGTVDDVVVVSCSCDFHIHEDLKRSKALRD